MRAQGTGQAQATQLRGAKRVWHLHTFSGPPPPPNALTWRCDSYSCLHHRSDTFLEDTLCGSSGLAGLDESLVW